MNRIRIFRYVGISDIGAYLVLGWHWDGASMHMPHGCYSVLLEFLGEGEPIEPEHWRDIPDFEGFYQASSYGRIRSLDRMLVKPFARCGYPRWVKGRVLSPRKTGKRGYLGVSLASNDRKINFYIAHLVALTFNGPCPDGLEVCHNDGKNTNNRPSNLRYDTHAANEADKVTHGTLLEGEKCPASRLTADQVREIRRRAIDEPFAGIAVDLGIKTATIQAIVSGKTWKSLPLLLGEAGTPEGNALKTANLSKRRSEFITVENKRRAS